MKDLCEKTLGELEAEISQAVIRLEKEIMGRGPLETRTFIIDDMVLIRLKGALTPSEIRLAESGDGQRGRYLVKQARQELVDHGRPNLESMVRDLLGAEVRSLHTDVSTKTGERVIVLSLDRNPLAGPGEKSVRTRNDHLDGRRQAIR